MGHKAAASFVATGEETARQGFSFEHTSSSSDWLPLSEMVKVFEGTMLLSSTRGWVTVPCQTPFEYNGQDNLVIAVDENTPGYHSSSAQFYCQATPETQALVYFSDGQNPNPADPPVGRLRNAVPSLQLLAAGPPGYHWTECSAEGGTCSCRGVVRYGNSDTWTTPQPVSGTTGCSSDVFGDPYPGRVNVCQCAAVNLLHPYSHINLRHNLLPHI